MEVWLPFDNVIYSVYLNHDLIYFKFTREYKSDNQ